MRFLIPVCCLLAFFDSFGQFHSKTAFITVDGKTIAYSSSGLQNRKPGEPIIIFESGAMTSRENFDTLFNYLPPDLPWITYDRPGIGQSQLDSAMATDLSIVKRLHDFLSSIKAAPPYILVGHSYGGILIRLFLATYPSEVTGMVLIDPTPFMWDESREQEEMHVEGNPVGFAGIWKVLSVQLLNGPMPPGQKLEAARLAKNITGYFAEYRSLPAIPDIPITVIMSYNETMPKEERENISPQHKLNENFGKHLRLIMTRDFQKLIENNNNSSFIALPGYPHYIHFRDPRRVAKELMMVYEKTLMKK